jgi:hypothetical protein
MHILYPKQFYIFCQVVYLLDLHTLSIEKLKILNSNPTPTIIYIFFGYIDEMTHTK